MQIFYEAELAGHSLVVAVGAVAAVELPDPRAGLKRAIAAERIVDTIKRLRRHL